MTVLIIHSHKLDKNGEPWEEYTARLANWLDLLIQGQVHKILLTGWMATPNISIMHSDAGKKWILQNGFNDSDKIFTEKSDSKETVWELVFARKEHDRDLFTPEKDIILLSSDYHLDRLKEIAQFVFWEREWNIDYIGISGFYRSLKEEMRSTQAFRQTFSWVPIGDIQKIEETLWKKHELYKNHPKNPYS